MILHPRLRSIGCCLLVAVAFGAVAGQPLDSIVEEEILDEIERQLEQTLVDDVDDAIASALDESLAALDRTASAALQAVEEILPSPDKRFVASVDEEGQTIEEGIWVLLVTPAGLAEIERRGLVVRERRRLPSLGSVLLRVEAPRDRRLAEEALRIAGEAPGTQVDYNHVFRHQAGRQGRERGEAPARASKPVATVPIGIVDTAVADEHEALRAARIEQKDFVPFAHPRPTGHGTAVASIVAGATATGRTVGLHAASVFFEDDAGRSTATTASLVQALDWLAGRGVRVVNMSLSGPPNRVLQAAVDGLAARGLIIVAAVGNAGPAAPPLYPAAYDSVVGVTAIDVDDRIYRYANRGPQVSFAAPGVDVSVARAEGGYGLESGTSMAAPLVTSVVARRLASSSATPAAVLAELKAAAVDLGEPGFDTTYGFGRITD